MRTVSVSPTAPTEGAPEDLDGRIVDGIESLAAKGGSGVSLSAWRVVHRPAPRLRLQHHPGAPHTPGARCHGTGQRGEGRRRRGDTQP